MKTPPKLTKEAEAEIREYSDAPIIYLDTPIAKNHLFAVRGKYSDFYETEKYVAVYLHRKLAKN